ncbi:uncharacterized protein C8Q71DRAFT_288682 [Rhodofomes roseus]|uniref:Integrase core domain-containing protein n=1 Tax=Rhodofomes roseus TaxID=34475 RepID=A0ABQ8K3N7_9APHY|nr:uncharacterized protein C8Q71DRAFT_288682 [Rhodofomes roseus]KAH9831504.1 hypothetical protein C8Q71DRAFT_288682 [Rhodofomes roseus]
MARNPLLKDKPSTSNNHSGKNGRDNGPDEEILKAALYRYSQERLPLPRRIKRLGHELQLDIGLTLLKNLNKHFGIPSSRKAPKGVAATQLVLNEMSEDSSGRRGIGAMQTHLAISGTPLPRSVIREVVRTNDPDGAAARYPGRKPQAILRGRLVALGPMYEVHCDGHDKLGALALQMGGVALPIYGYKDKCSSVCIQLVIIPNNRKADVVGHTYCDWSVHNTPIESFWHAFRQHTGRNLYAAIVRGKEDGIFHVNNELHECLFYWIWPQIVQRELTDFRDYWNMHKLRVQRDKLMPSGTTPTDLWIAPEDYGHVRISIPVPRDAVEAMRRERLPISRDEAFSWVDHEFATSAEQAYSSLGCPRLNKDTAWEVFSRMEPMLKY